jgi:WD40 repeat protein
MIPKRRQRNASDAKVDADFALQRDPVAMLNGLSLEQLQTTVLPRWKLLERTTSPGGLDENVFVATLVDAVLERFPSISMDTAVRILVLVYAEVDAADTQCVSWDTFAAFLMDAANARSPSNKKGRSMSSATAAVSGPPRTLLVDTGLKSVNVLANSVDLVNRMYCLDPFPLVAMCTRGGVVHIASSKDHALVRSTRLDFSVTTAVFIHDRELRQSIPGIFAVRSCLVVFTTGMRLHVLPCKEFDCRTTYAGVDNVLSLSFCRDDQLLYGGTTTGALLAWFMDAKGELTLVRRLHLGTNMPLNAVTFMPGHRALVAASEHERHVMEVHLGKERFPAVAAHLECTSVVGYGGPRREKLSPQQLQAARDASITVLRHAVAYAHIDAYHTGTGDGATAVAHSAPLKMIVAAFTDFSVHCFIESVPAIPALRLDCAHLPHSSVLSALSLDRAGVMLATTDRGGVVKVWDLKTLQVMSSIIVSTTTTATAQAPGIGIGLPGVQCSCVVHDEHSASGSGSILVNTNTNMHVLAMEHPADVIDGCMLEDPGDPLVLVQHHAKLPNCVIAVSAACIVIWDILYDRKRAQHVSPYVAVSAACVDAHCTRVVLGSATGELCVVRLDTNRLIRSYAMPPRCGEVTAVTFAVAAAQLVATTEDGRIVVLDDAGSNEYGDCPVFRVVALPGGIDLRTLVAHGDGYLAIDGDQTLRHFVYDAHEGCARLRNTFGDVWPDADDTAAAAEAVAAAEIALARRRSSLHPTALLNAAPTADGAVTSEQAGVSTFCAMGDYPAVVVAGNDGTLAVWALAPHVLENVCVARWPNTPFGGGRFRSPAAATAASNNARTPRFGNKSHDGRCAVSLLLWVPPYTLVATDDKRQLTVWDLSDVVLQARLLCIARVSAKARAAATGAASVTHFHEVDRPPIVRCAATRRLFSVSQQLAWLPPNGVCVTDSIARPSVFLMLDNQLARVGEEIRPCRVLAPDDGDDGNDGDDDDCDAGGGDVDEDIDSDSEDPTRFVNTAQWRPPAEKHTWNASPTFGAAHGGVSQRWLRNPELMPSAGSFAGDASVALPASPLGGNASFAMSPSVFASPTFVAPRRRTYRALWRKARCVIKTLWIISKFSAASTQDRRRAAVQQQRRNFPYSAVEALVIGVGVAPSQSVPTLHSLSWHGAAHRATAWDTLKGASRFNEAGFAAFRQLGTKAHSINWACRNKALSMGVEQRHAPVLRSLDARAASHGGPALVHGPAAHWEGMGRDAVHGAAARQDVAAERKFGPTHVPEATVVHRDGGVTACRARRGSASRQNYRTRTVLEAVAESRAFAEHAAAEAHHDSSDDDDDDIWRAIGVHKGSAAEVSATDVARVAERPLFSTARREATEAPRSATAGRVAPGTAPTPRPTSAAGKTPKPLRGGASRLAGPLRPLSASTRRTVVGGDRKL